MAIRREASVLDVLELRDENPLLTTLFLDESELCENYLKNNPWVEEIAEVLFVDYGIVEIFGITVVPFYKFWVDGCESGHVIGTCKKEIVLEYRDEAFGNLAFFPRKKKDDEAGSHGFH